MDWSGVDYLWIIVMFLSAVWTLILTAPIHCDGLYKYETLIHLSSYIIIYYVSFHHIVHFTGWLFVFLQVKSKSKQIPQTDGVKSVRPTVNTEVMPWCVSLWKGRC